MRLTDANLSELTIQCMTLSAFSDDFDISRLEIHLEEPLKDEKGASLGDKIEVRILAKMILDYWQKYPHIS